MQSALPITIVAAPHFSSSLAPLLHKLEMWINFQALKANWYGNEALSLTFEFTLIKTLNDKKALIAEEKEEWVEETGLAYRYDITKQSTLAFIAVADLVAQGTGIEQAIKARLTKVSNDTAVKHGLSPLT